MELLPPKQWLLFFVFSRCLSTAAFTTFPDATGQEAIQCVVLGHCRRLPLQLQRGWYSLAGEFLTLHPLFSQACWGAGSLVADGQCENCVNNTRRSEDFQIKFQNQDEKASFKWERGKGIIENSIISSVYRSDFSLILPVREEKSRNSWRLWFHTRLSDQL